MADDPTKPAEGAPEGDELDEPTTDEPEGGAEGGDGEEEWTPPTREEYERQQAEHKAALEAERAKLARARKQAERLRTGRAAPAGEGAGGEGGQGAAQGGDVDVWRERAVRSAAKAALLDRGADSETVSLMLAGLKPARIEFDDDGDPELDDYLDEMEERYPKLFAKQAAAPSEPARPRPGRVDQGAAAGAGRPVRPKLGIGQQIIANSQAATRAGRRGI
jgi:hypothetical protein